MPAGVPSVFQSSKPDVASATKRTCSPSAVKKRGFDGRFVQPKVEQICCPRIVARSTVPAAVPSLRATAAL